MDDEEIERRAREQLGEDSAYERFVLASLSDAEALYRDNVEQVLDLRGEHAHIGITVNERLGATGREAVERYLGLIFGAAYKVLDLIVECAMKLQQYPWGRWTFAEKTDWTIRGAAPSPFTSQPELWDRLTALYRNWLETRHSLVHRRALVEEDGTLRTRNKGSSELPPISAADQERAALLMFTVAQCVISNSLNARHRRAIAHYVDRLSSHHGMSKLGSIKPGEARKVIANLDKKGDGWKLDLKRIVDRVTSAGNPRSADLELHGRTPAGEIVFSVMLEELDDVDELVFDESNLPSAMTRQE